MPEKANSWATRAWVLQVLAYVLAFGVFATTAVAIGLLGLPEENFGLFIRIHDAVELAGFVIAVIALLIAHRGLGLSGSELGLRSPGAMALGVLGATGVAYVAMQVGFKVMQILPEWPLPAGQERGMAAEAVNSAHGAFVEETLLLALPMAIMTRLRVSWPVQLLVLIALRLPSHLYYGPQALVLCAIWVGGFLLVYRRIKLVWPFVVAHLVYNFVNAGFVPGLVGVAVSLALIIVGIIAIISWVSQRNRERAPQSR